MHGQIIMSYLVSWDGISRIFVILVHPCACPVDVHAYVYWQTALYRGRYMNERASVLQ